MDVLSLIPTHLTSQSDRLRASFVCRYWRRILLQRAQLWSQLFLSKGQAYVETLLERAGGSALDITVGYRDWLSKIRLLSSHTRQIGRLKFLPTSWAKIHMFSQIISGPMPLLQVLEITISGSEHTRPSPFDLATNFSFYSNPNRPPFLNSFLCPNLTFFRLSTSPSKIFHASQLLDFLETSPMLRTVHLEVIADISLHQVPQRNVVVLPNIENFELVMSDGRSGYKMATRISCPSARRVSLTHKIESYDTISEDFFPTPDSWDAIVSHYSRNPIEGASLETSTTPILICKLSFLSPGPNVIELYCQVVEEDLSLAFAETRNRVFAQATRTVRSHPQLANLRRLHICHNHRSVGTTDVPYLASDVSRLFKSLGPLDELIISRSDLRPYFNSFLEGPAVFPKIKELAISHPVYQFPAEYTSAVVGFARRQYVRGIALERVIICAIEMEWGLRLWVSSI